jgi:hypothetical protein
VCDPQGIKKITAVLFSISESISPDLFLVMEQRAKFSFPGKWVDPLGAYRTFGNPWPLVGDEGDFTKYYF